jgi:hypothetical protein
LLARFESGERLPCWHTHPDIRIEAVTDVALESISCSALFAMARNNDALRLALLRAASDDERMFIGIMKRLHEPIEVRIVTYLLERPAQPAITRREIAAAAGTITDVSDRILRKLNRAQAIRYERGRIVDRSPARLQRYLGDVSSR